MPAYNAMVLYGKGQEHRMLNSDGKFRDVILLPHPQETSVNKYIFIDNKRQDFVLPASHCRACVSECTCPLCGVDAGGAGSIRLGCGCAFHYLCLQFHLSDAFDNNDPYVCPVCSTSIPRNDLKIVNPYINIWSKQRSGSCIKYCYDSIMEIIGLIVEVEKYIVAVPCTGIPGLDIKFLHSMSHCIKQVLHCVRCVQVCNQASIVCPPRTVWRDLQVASCA